MADELGAAHVGQLDARYPHPGVSDLVTYWFPLAHDALKSGGRCGFVATQAIRENESRKRSLDYVVAHDGVIFEAVSRPCETQLVALADGMLGDPAHDLGSTSDGRHCPGQPGRTACRRGC